MNVILDSQDAGGSSTSTTPRKKVYIKTYGCQMNEYDSQKLAKILEQDYDLTDDAIHADLMLVNTCSVRDKPEQKLYSLLGEIRELKDINPHLLVGVGGCVAQQEGATISKRSDAVDFVFGTHNLSLVPALITRRKETGLPQIAVDYREEWEELPLGYTGKERTSVFISISRGCNKACSYCIVPTTRGKEVSRSATEIEREVKIAAHRGAKEVVLLGQTVNSWGRDLTPRRSFAELIAIVAQIDGIKRIRFVSPHPQDVKDDFISLLKECPKLCKHIHLPLQSGSDVILKAMNRNYRARRYLEIVDALKGATPDIGITTDIIVGFPGETVEDFEATLEVMRRVEFQSSYSFIFSPRPGTVAEQLENDVPDHEKLRRLQQLQLLQEEISKKVLAAHVGRVAEVLIEGAQRHDSEAFHGRNEQNIAVNLMAHPGLTPGMLVKARINEVSRFSLRGEVIE